MVIAKDGGKDVKFSSNYCRTQTMAAKTKWNSITSCTISLGHRLGCVQLMFPFPFFLGKWQRGRQLNVWMNVKILLSLFHFILFFSGALALSLLVILYFSVLNVCHIFIRLQFNVFFRPSSVCLYEFYVCVHVCVMYFVPKLSGNSAFCLLPSGKWV